MKTIGIIAEYNPFHTGHAWQLHEGKRRAGADFAAVVMSGDFVQRGEPAIIDKFTRTRMALAGGADLVLELPLQYACGSAEYFARGAVTLLHRIKAVDALCFGCEDENPDAFETLAELLACEPALFRTHLKSLLSSGISYPKARFLALESYLKETGAAKENVLASDLLSLLSSPNNTLGLEYLLACKHEDYEMDILPIRRRGAAYHDCAPADGFASASAIRSDLSLMESFIPPKSLAFLQEAGKITGFRKSEDYSALFHYALLMENDYSRYLDVTSDLSDRIRSLLPFYESWGQFVSLLKTKQLTEARIRRCLLHILLGIQKDIFSGDRLPGLSYARVLGFRKTALPLLKQIKKEGEIPLLSKIADAQKLLNPQEYKLLRMNLRASQIYHSTAQNGLPYNEYQRQLIIYP